MKWFIGTGILTSMNWNPLKNFPKEDRRRTMK
jgi:hypothetical protein